MMITVFSLMLNSAVMAEEYDYTVFRDVDGVPVAVDNPQSCSTFFDLFDGAAITMTPIYRKICKTGEYNIDNDNCGVIARRCDPGKYLDLSGDEPACRECPVGYWCPETYLSVSFSNEAMCGANNIAEDGMTEENKNYKWKNNKCIDSNGNTVAGINSESECGFTSIGKCKCPGETTTRANKKEGFGLNSTSIGACAYYDLEPGQQLKRSEDTEHNYEWENGKCIDKDTDEEVTSIKSSVYCGYTYKKETCDADNFCLGGVFTAAKYKDSMNACPDKYNDVVTIDNASDCATAKVNGFAWNATIQKCVIAGTTTEIKNITTSTACTNANAIKGDLVWNTDKCLLTGHSDTGSFRCSYTCPAGYYMHVVNQYDNYAHSHYVVDYYTSDYFLGGWRADLTTCEPCPEGSYCLGGTFFRDATHNDTKYHADTYSAEQPKYYSNNTSYGISGCPTNSVTMGMGSDSVDDCKKFCPAGQYYSGITKQCESCATKQNLGEMAYCPGGIVYDNNSNEDAGIITCDQQNVILVGVNVEDIPVIIKSDDDRNKYVHPNESKTACSCPEGYEWNKITRACCAPNKVCCGAGLDLHRYSDGTYECKPCGSGNEATECGKSICSSDTDQSPECLACRNKTYCPGAELTINEVCVFDENQYRGSDNKCYTCGAGSVPSGYNEDKREYTSCTCTLAQMTTDMNAGGAQNRFPELNDTPSPGLVRHWNGSVCELDTYYVGVRYSNIDLSGSVYGHGRSCGWYDECDYWSQYYRYGQIRNKNGEYVDGNTFAFDWSPSELGYNFSNPVTPEEGLANPESMSARKVKDGYVFAGWCRETEFCCPAGYKEQDLESGKKECVICPNGDKTSDNCNGSKWVAPDTKPVIDTKAQDNRIAPASFKYYAMMIADSICPAGTTLNTTTIQCVDCPVGYYCPGGVVSPRQPGRHACPRGTYREYTKGTQSAHVSDPVNPDNYDGCKPCAAGVSEELSKQSDTVIQVPAGNGLITQSDAATSVNQCGYYCEEKYYDAADNRFKCDVSCPAGWYCPGSGPVPGYSKYNNKFFDWKHQGEGKLLCPNGLGSDVGARQCYTDPGCTPKHYKWKKAECINENNDTVVSNITSESGCTAAHYTWQEGECIDEDTNTTVLISESECVYTGYYKKKDSVTGAYVCVNCGANNLLTDSYYYCPGFDKLNVDLIDNTVTHQDAAGRYGCGENPVTHIKKVSDDNADHCYELANAGKYIDPETGLPEPCKENHFCNGREDSVAGQRRCPYGSVSSIGAQFVTDCHCVSGEAYRPTGVYYEKGAELVQYGQTLNDFACMNTYLVVDNPAPYDAAEDSISSARARVVSCRWVNNQANPGENDAPDGKYSNCTEKAVDICYKSVWNNTVIGPDVLADDLSRVSTSDVLKWLASSLYTDTEQQTIQHLMTRLSTVSSVQSIPTVDNWQSCQTSILCMDGFAHYDDTIGICYADITYQNVDDEDITWPIDPENPGEYLSNPAQYTPDMLPFILRNPKKPHHVFDGWCLNGETEEDCLGNNNIVSDEEGNIVTFVEREIPEGTTGDLEFIAQWKMVCPDDYSHHDGILTDVTQCYAVVEFDANKDGLSNPESRIEQYSEGATTYTLATLPELSVTGYSFGGWYDNAELIGDAVTTETELSGDKTLYAKWNAEVYSITYNGIADANVSGNPDSYTIESEDITLNNPTKEDYEFLGWCDDEGLSENCLTEKTILSGSTGNKEFWAKWQEIETCSADFPEGNFGDCYATITYENMFGATLPVGVSNPDIYTAEMVAEHSIQLPVPMKTGYEFLGWYDNSGFVGAPVENIPVGSTGNKKYWAKWQAPECESGKYLHIGDNAICLYETKPTSPALVVKTGDTKYYAHMCTDCDKTMNGATGSKLHIRYNNKTYNVYDLTAQ